MRHTSVLRTWLLLPSLALASFGCEEDPGLRALRIAGAFEPASLQFGEVPLDMSRALPVTLSNVGEGLFTIEGIEVPEGFSLRGVKGTLEGTSLQPADTLDFEVVFFPTEEGTYDRVLTVRAVNTTVELALSGVGVRRRIPVLSIDPTSIDFGNVALGESARASFTVRNSGTAPATLDRASLRSTGRDVAAGDTFLIGTQLPVVVQVEESVTLEVVYMPTTEGRHVDVMAIGASGEAPPLELGLGGNGIVPLGDILCEPSLIAFGQVERGQVARRDVTCTARGGPARLISGAIAGNPMFVLPQPPATVDLMRDESVTVPVEFHPEGLPSVQRGTLRLNYAGGMGAASVQVDLTGEVIPPPPTATAFTIVMRWNTNNTDMDIHLLRPGATLFDPVGDCHYANRSPDWGRQRDASDDPFLDVDDIDGFGPETINLSETAAGQYQVWVHSFRDLLRTTPTVEIHLAGNLAGTYNRPNLACGQAWHVGTINWNGTSGTFTPSTTVNQSVRPNACF